MLWSEKTCRLPTKAVPDTDLRAGPHLVLAKRLREVPNWGRCHDVGRVLIAFVTWSALNVKNADLSKGLARSHSG